jgi:CTP synthase (UTP-ammonia lyase)
LPGLGPGADAGVDDDEGTCIEDDEDTCVEDDEDEDQVVIDRLATTALDLSRGAVWEFRPRIVDGGDLGGTMRLGAYDATLTRGSRVARIYGSTEISERHRHRYEVNTTYKGRLEQHGMRFSGMSPDGILPEIVEYEDHPWFIGVQFHPELKSRPFEPHPLFASFVEAALEQSRLV